MRGVIILILAAFLGCGKGFVYVANTPAFSLPALPATAVAPFTHEAHAFPMKNFGDGNLIADPTRHWHRRVPRLGLRVLERAFLAEARASGAFQSVRIEAEPKRGREKLSLIIVVQEATFKHRENRTPPDQLTLSFGVRAQTLTDGRVVWEGTVRKSAQGYWKNSNEPAAQLLKELYAELIKKVASGVSRD